MAEDPSKTAAVTDVITAVFAALDDPGLARTDVRGGSARWPFDGLQLAAYKCEVGAQARSMEEIKQFVSQMVGLRDKLMKQEAVLDEFPDDEEATKTKASLEADIPKYRRMAESFFRGGAREHIKDMD